MSYLAALGQAGMAQEDRARRAMEEEERQRLMAARRASDADMVTKRQRTEADYQAGRATSLDLPGLPTGNAKWPGVVSPQEPAAPAATDKGASAKRNSLAAHKQTKADDNAVLVTEASNRLQALKRADTQAMRDRRALLNAPTAALDVIQAPAALGLNLFGGAVSGAQNVAGRVVNAIAGRDVLPTDVEYRKYSATPLYDKYVRAPEQAITTAEQRLKSLQGKSTTASEVQRPVAPTAADPNFERFKAAIFGQESGNGAVDTSRPNYAGALGKGQILQSTFEGLKQQGKIPANYQWTNPQHNEEAAVAYMREAWQAAGGNPELAAAYYYGGPKAIAGGQVNTYRDLKNPNAPTTNQYAQQVLQRMGQAATSVFPAAQAAPAPGLPAPQPVAIDRSALGGGTGVDDRELQYQRMVLADIQRRLQTAPTAEAQQTLITQARQLQLNIMNGELQGVAQRAQAGDPQAVDQLAQMAQVQYANTPQGLVTVTVDPYTGQGRAASQPMDVPTFSQMLFQRASSVARQAMAASSAKIAEQRAKTEGEIAVERERGVNALRTAMAQSQGRLQEEMLKHSLTQDQVKDVKAAGPLGREVIIVTRNDGAVFEVQPGGTVNGMTSPPRLVPIQ